MNVRDEIANIESKEELAKFVKQLADDLLKNPDTWENASLPDFLEAMASWIEDMDGYYANTQQKFNVSQPSWKNFADILMGATMYE